MQKFKLGSFAPKIFNIEPETWQTMISNSEWVYHLNLGSREILSSGKVQPCKRHMRFRNIHIIKLCYECMGTGFFFKEITRSTPNNLKGRFIPNNLLLMFQRGCGAGMSLRRACETGSTEDIMFPDCHSIPSKTSPDMSSWYLAPHQVETKMWGVVFLMASWQPERDVMQDRQGPDGFFITEPPSTSDSLS